MPTKRIHLRAWAKARYEPVLADKTLQLWARTGRIKPRPVKHGRDWWVETKAEYVEREAERAHDKRRPRRK